MKKIVLFSLAIALGIFAGCDKVQNAYPPDLVDTSSLDWSLYPDGDSAHYAQQGHWPTFTANTNTNRNIVIEDFTGHKCTFCPAAAAVAEQLEHDNPGRVFVSAVHASPNGVGNFQETDATYTHDFTNTASIEIGTYFGDNLAGSPFQGNPNGTVSRVNHGNGYPVTHPSSWTSATNSMLAANTLKVNIQSDANYFASTRGLFVHTETEVLDSGIDHENLKIVVQLHEDSIVQPQLDGSTIVYDYVHRDVLRGCIDGRTFGQTLDDDHEENEKFYFNYSYALPSQYDPSNMHLLIYVRDVTTEEIYQVIKQKLQ